MADGLTLQSIRARKARLGKSLNQPSAVLLTILCIAVAGVAVYLSIDGTRIAALLCVPAIFGLMFTAWWQYDLSTIEVTGDSLDDRISKDVLVRLRGSDVVTPKLLWQRLTGHWQFFYVCNHLFIPPNLIEDHLSEDASDTAAVWSTAIELADQANSKAILPGQVALAILLTNHSLMSRLSKLKISSGDLRALNRWLGRGLAAIERTRPSFGGIGRDWASGFTPSLNHFGNNVSLAIEKHGAHFGSLVESPGVRDIKTSFSNGTTAVALIGENGVGKTKHAYALAQSLLAENQDRNLEHHQVVSLSPSSILSAAQRPGELEYIFNMLFNEAAHAGNIIVFMDDAQLFFSNGAGSFDATQLLLPIVQSGAIQMVFAMTPRDYQLLKAANQSFAGALTPVVLNEPSEQDTLEAIEDAATQFEHRHQVLITLAATREAYRLSGRYEQDMAYPGKAIRLLEQALTHAEEGVVSERSVQQAIEQTKGVKAGSAAPVEANKLLRLEDEIHQRMINQSRAVSVVSNALRRARAGVANPNRPIGSFLFLGPTGVGKTELAKSIAATYFGDQTSMIRVDMSEFQQSSDVSRLLSDSKTESTSLLMQIRQKPYSVVLLDEIEKAHPNVLNLLLQLLDEGQLTDSAGRAASFKDAVIICTSNAGADQIRQRIEQGQSLESFETEFTDQLISSGQFKPELLNRFDEIVLFRPLNAEELAQVVQLMLQEVNKTLATQQITLELTPAAITKIVETGNDPRLGARPMRRTLQRAVEDTVAKRILQQQANPGDHITLDVGDLGI